MLNEKVINIDYEKIGLALNEVTEPKIIIMNDATLLACLADDPDLFEENESELGSSFSLNGVTISLNPEYEFGYIVVK